MTLSEFRYKLECKVEDKKAAASKAKNSKDTTRDTAFAEGLEWALGFLEQVEESEKKYKSIADALCDFILDLPMGCDSCPIHEEGREDCELYHSTEEE